MRVALINSFHAPDAVGGAEVVTASLAAGLAGRGHEVVVIALAPPATSARTEVVDGIRVRRVPLANVFWPVARVCGPLAVTGLFHAIDRYNPVMGARVRAVLAEERPDVVHTHNLLGFSTAVWAAARAVAVPIVHTLHDQRLLCHRGSGVDRRGVICERRCVECRVVGVGKLAATTEPAAVVGVSRWILDHHLAAGAFEGVAASVIHNATAAVPHVARPSEHDGPLRIGFLGRLVAEKGTLDLVAAVKQLGARGAKVELVIAGDGPERGAIERAAVGAPIVVLGPVDRDRLLDAVDVLVVPSRWHEPFGLVAAEAAMRGVPVIASRRGGLPEIVEHGVTGLLYEPDQPDGLLAAISTASEDRSGLVALGRAAQARASRFDLDRQVEAYVDVYRRAIAASDTITRTPAAAVARTDGEPTVRCPRAP